MFKINENKHIKGFSLIEVVTVLLLLSILSIVIVPRMFDTGAGDTVTLDKIKTHLRYAQLRSMNTQINWGIKFDNSSHTYWLFNNESSNTENDAIVLPTEASAQISFNSSMTVSPALITFDILGRPFTDAAAQSAFTTETVNLGNGKTITITKNTGFIP